MMNRNPRKGDVIVIGNAKQQLLVVNTQKVISEDRIRGDSYWANVFDTVPFRVDGAKGDVIEQTQPPKRWMTDGCMHAGVEVNRNNIKLVGTVKFKTETTVKHTITKAIE